MASENLNKFLKALEAVKKDYTCGVCLHYCNNPVTLSKCFHVICSEHFDELKICPICKTNLEGCTKFYDPDMSNCVNATKKLDTFFQNYATNLPRNSDDGTIADKTSNETHTSQLPSDIKNAENNVANKVEITEVTPTRSKKQTYNLKSNTSSGKRTTKQSKKDDENCTNKSTSSKTKLLDVFSDNNTNTSIKDHKTIQEKLKKSNLSEKNIQPDLDTNVTRRKKQIKATVTNASKKMDIKPLEPESGDVTNILTVSNKFNKANEKRNHKGETLLHIACRLGNVERVKELLQQGANTNTKDYAGWTPLHEVVQNGRLDLVQLLLQYNALIDVPGQGNETPLHEAVRYNHVDIAVELVKRGADINARNCKGETPHQLGSIDMKVSLLAAAEDIIQTQTLNVTHMSLLHSELDFDDIRVYCVSQSQKIQTELKALAKAHSNLKIEPRFSKKVSHVIVDTDHGVCTSSLDVLQGIVNSLWILSSEWVTKSTKDTLEPFEKHEVKGVENISNNGPKNSRYNKYKQLPGIFDGCHFYLHNFNDKYEISKNLILTKANLSKLITDAGGVVLHRVPNPEAIPDKEKLVPYHATKGGKLVNCSHYIIFNEMFQPMYNMQHLKALPIGWLIQCLEQYELCEPWDL